MPADELAILPDQTQCQTLITDILTNRLRQQGQRMPHIAPNADLVELGLVDSQTLFDIIMEVEKQSGWLFDPDRIDLETEITLCQLAAAFVSE